MIKYSSSKNDILKDGHTMFTLDVVAELNRKAHLEQEMLKGSSAKLQQKTLGAEELLNNAIIEKQSYQKELESLKIKLELQIKITHNYRQALIRSLEGQNF